MRTDGFARALAVGQGTYWVITGTWPLVSLGTFELVTGPKASGWLVKTVGALITAVGATLVMAGARDRVTPEIALLGAGSAAALGGAGGWYAARGRIRRIYLADAAAEALIVAAWGVVALRRPQRVSARGSPSAFPVERREAVPEI